MPYVAHSNSVSGFFWFKRTTTGLGLFTLCQLRFRVCGFSLFDQILLVFVFLLSCRYLRGCGDGRLVIESIDDAEAQCRVAGDL
jgi:hypothetical protein